MAGPSRMSTVEVRIRLQKEAGATLPVDSVFNVKIGTLNQQFAAAISMYGQPRFIRAEDMQQAAAGDAVYTQGYIVFSAAELARVGVTPNAMKHARVVGFKRAHNAVGEYDSAEYQIVEVRPRGHLNGIATIYKMYFEKYGDLRGAVR